MQKCIRAFVMEAKASKIQRVHVKLDHEPINYGFEIAYYAFKQCSKILPSYLFKLCFI